MGKSQVNLQDIFLNQMRKEKIPVTMYLVNGARLTGMIKGFDNFVILLKQENQQLVYKHAISTIIPDKPVELVWKHGDEKEKRSRVRCKAKAGMQMFGSQSGVNCGYQLSVSFALICDNLHPGIFKGILFMVRRSSKTEKINHWRDRRQRFV